MQIPRHYTQTARLAWRQRPPFVVASLLLLGGLFGWYNGGNQVADYILYSITGDRMNTPLALAWTPYFIIAVLIVLLFWVAYVLSQYMKRLEPRLALSRGVSSMPFVDTPVSVAGRPGKARYLGCVVETDSEGGVPDCTAWLDSIRKFNSQTGQFDQIFSHQVMLTWSGFGKIPINIPKGRRPVFDILQTNDIAGHPEIADPLFMRLNMLLAQPGRYAIEIVVFGSGVPHRATVQFEWGPNWNDVKAEIAVL